MKFFMGGKSGGGFLLFLFLLSGSVAGAGSWLDRYWPMHGGDSKMFEYVFYNQPYHLAEDVYSLGGGEYKIVFDGPAYYEIHHYSNTGSAITLNHYSNWASDYELIFDTPVALLNDEVLQNGGTLQSSVQGSLLANGVVEYAGWMTFTTKVSKSGPVTVLGGTLDDCRNVVVKVTFSGRGTYPFLSGVLAPDVGFIKMINADGISSQMDGGTVGGWDVAILSYGAPKVSFQTPASGQRVPGTNNPLPVVGGVSGYLAGMQVWYAVNDGPATNAVVTGTDWSGSVPLLPGTNIVSAYAVDAVGRTSSVANVKFQQVVTGLLQVLVTGNGKVTPNYTNALLELGRNYTLKAKGANGFAFTNWTAWIAGDMVLSTNSATVNFMMQSNLVLAAAFADVQKPKLKVVSPKKNQHVTNQLFAIHGTVKDNGSGGTVWYQLNGGDWIEADGWLAWSSSISLLSGSNLLQVCAADAAGNRSVTNTLRLYWDSPANPGTNALGLAARVQEPQIDSAGIILNGGRLAFSYQGVVGKTVVIETSSDLMNWVPVHTNSLADEARQFTDCPEGDGDRKFYRLKIIQPTDR